MTLADHVERYVTFRRALGHAYVEQARCLQDTRPTPRPMVTASCAAHGPRLGIDNAVSRQAQVKLRYVCDLASVLHAEDERHEVPDRDALGKAVSRRPSPHLLSLTEIGRIMDAALELPPAGSITPLTFHYILGADRRDRIAALGGDRPPADGT